MSWIQDSRVVNLLNNRCQTFIPGLVELPNTRRLPPSSLFRACAILATLGTAASPSL